MTIREVARRVEVSPAAIYRHFPDREALLGEVAHRALLDLARCMLDEVESVVHSDPKTRAIRRFLALGRGYLRFAAAEPNLLAAAFLPMSAADADGAEADPWSVLAAALDELVETGAMPPERRPGAETIAWSAVHGFAVLRADHAFEFEGQPEPDPERLLDAIARSLGVVAAADRTTTS